MSFSDRQHFSQTLAQARNLAIACEQTQPHSSLLRTRCESFIQRIDDVAHELVGDASYFKVIDA